MRLSPRAVLHFGAVWLAAVCRPAVAQLTDTQQVYDLAIKALFREDVDITRPRIVFIARVSGTWPRASDSGARWARFPDSSYRARYSDPSSSRLVWGDVPGELRESFRGVAAHEIEIRSQDLPPDARLVEGSSSPRTQVSLSAIAFTPDSSEALVYLHVHCGGLCGGGDIVYLRRKRPGSWFIAATFPLWRS